MQNLTIKPSRIGATLSLIVICIAMAALNISCESEVVNTKLIRVQKKNSQSQEIEHAYVNQSGDTIVSLGQYSYCFRDTIKDFGVVVEKQSGKFLAIDIDGLVMYEVYKYDNGPDYLSEDLFRIVLNEKIGYANIKGEVIIEPRFACAYPFENGQAKVSLDCQEIREGEHTRWESDNWFYINKEGGQM